MSKKILFFVGLSAGIALQSMDKQPSITTYSSTGSDYVICQKGLGSTATQEVIHDPELAEMMREMDRAEAACNARVAQERKAAKEAAAKKEEKTFASGLTGGAKKMFGGSK